MICGENKHICFFHLPILQTIAVCRQIILRSASPDQCREWFPCLRSARHTERFVRKQVLELLHSTDSILVGYLTLASVPAPTLLIFQCLAWRGEVKTRGNRPCFNRKGFKMFSCLLFPCHLLFQFTFGARLAKGKANPCAPLQFNTYDMHEEN